MATRQADDGENTAASPACQCKQKDGYDQSEMSPLTPLSPEPEDEVFSWPGPKTLRLYRTSQGFGFTLRHFIVYPPQSAVQYSFKDEDNGSRGKQWSRLEPMDTIFVKQVKEGGSAHQAGLCTGDRIVKVNGESIIGKTYSQVIALIQNSDTSLELCVMPKNEDILQLFTRDITALAYSKDAYMKGNEAYSGNAQNIPEPPPICYPRLEHRTSGMTQPEVLPAPLGGQGVVPQGTELSSSPDVGYHGEIPVFQSPPVSLPIHVCKAQTVACVHSRNVGLTGMEISESSHLFSSTPNPRVEEDKGLNAASSETPASVCLISQTTPPFSSGRGTQLYCTPKRPPETVPSHTPSHPDISLTPHSLSTRGTLIHCMPKRQAPSHPDLSSTSSIKQGSYIYNFSPLVTTSTPCSPLHQNIDWKNYTTYKEYIDNKRLYTYGSRTIQERLDTMRAASLDDKTNVNGPQPGGTSLSHERGLASPGVSSLHGISLERLESKKGVASRDWRRSASQDALSLSTKTTHKPRTLSCDYLSRQDERGVSVMDRRIYGRTETEKRTILCTEEEARDSIQSGMLNKVEQCHWTMGGYSSLPRINTKSKGTDHILSHRANSLSDAAAFRPRLTKQTSILDDSYVAKALASLNSGATSALATMKDQKVFPIPHHMPLTGKPENHPEATGSTFCPDHSKSQRTLQGSKLLVTNGSVPEGIEGAEATVVVVKRERLKRAGKHPLRHPSYIQAVNEGVGEKKKLTEDPTCCMVNNSTTERCIRRLGEEPKLLLSKHLHDSLESIPFIDEPSSPSAELENVQIPDCTISTNAPSTTSPSTILHHQHAHNQDTLSFTVLDLESGAKTEHSKSQEGMDTFRDEGHGSMIKNIAGQRRLKKAVDQSSEDSGSRRNSSSDMFCETTKEGMLNFRQLSSEKSKRVGGSVRSWKQMFTVLRGHTLYLYKDRKEGQSPNSQTEEEPLPISIKACLIDISYSDTKRKNVLRLTTSDCDYLFQAEDREEMLAWIQAIQENSNLDEENALITSTDLINRKIKEYNNLMSPSSCKTEASPRSSRQSLSIRHTLLGGKGENKTLISYSPNKDQERKFMHKDESSPSKDKGPWTKGIPGLVRKSFERKAAPGVTFGVRLDDCPPAHTNRFVPLIVEVCCKLVEERGLEYTGIYRVPGNNAAISSMQEELNRGVGGINTHEDKWKDLNVISSLLKSFFRKLPEPLFTNEKYADFIEANRTEDPVARLKVLKGLLHELPDHHYETLKFLSAHLKTVAENSEKNKMEPRNLAIVFGPTLVRTSEDNMTHMVTHMPDQYKIVETLIQNYDWFFTEEGDDEEPVTVVQTESAVETQPVPNINHLLTNIGRTGTSAGEVSESPTSDSAKSKGSLGSGMDQFSRELVSSIFAAANRKRKKPKERKLQASSSDDDLDAVFLEHEPQTQMIVAGNTSKPGGNIDREETIAKNHKEQRNTFFVKKPLVQPLESQKSANLISRSSRPSMGKASDPPSQVEEPTSDLGTMSSVTYKSRKTSEIASTSAPLAPFDLPSSIPTGGSVIAEVSSITSDYSTTSSMTFLTGAESSMLSVDVQSRGGDEADDERSELISEGQQMETDSETDFPIVTRGDMTTSVLTCKIAKKREVTQTGYVQTTGNQHLPPYHRLKQHQSLSCRQSLQQKTDSESSLDGPSGSVQKGKRISRSEPSRLSRVLEAVKNGRSTGSLSSASSSSHSQFEPVKRLSLSDMLKSRFKLSADDMFGISGHKNGKKKEKRVHRRHTMGGQRDFKELAVINDWCEQGGIEKRAELSDVDRLRPQRSRDVSVRDRVSHERWFTATFRAGAKGSEVKTGTVEDLSHPTSMPSCQSSADHLNGGEPKCKGKANVNLSTDAHPHKLSGAQVVCSHFYQCL